VTDGAEACMRQGIKRLFGVIPTVRILLDFFVYLCMTKKDIYKLDFEIDKLTDSILNTISGDSFQTEVSLLSKSDLKTITKSKGWLFNWKYEFDQPDREVYKLTIIDNTEIVQGLLVLL
jgi:hypothetical protein